MTLLLITPNTNKRGQIPDTKTKTWWPLTHAEMSWANQCDPLRTGTLQKGEDSQQSWSYKEALVADPEELWWATAIPKQEGRNYDSGHREGRKSRGASPQREAGGLPERENTGWGWERKRARWKWGISAPQNCCSWDLLLPALGLP